jgi:hypothetical protein
MTSRQPLLNLSMCLDLLQQQDLIWSQEPVSKKLPKTHKRIMKYIFIVKCCIYYFQCKDFVRVSTTFQRWPIQFISRCFVKRRGCVCEDLDEKRERAHTLLQQAFDEFMAIQ